MAQNKKAMGGISCLPMAYIPDIIKLTSSGPLGRPPESKSTKNQKSYFRWLHQVPFPIPKKILF